MLGLRCRARIAIFTRELALMDRDGEKASLSYAEIARVRNAHGRKRRTGYESNLRPRGGPVKRAR